MRLIQVLVCIVALLLFGLATNAAPISGSWGARSLLMPPTSLPFKVSDTELCLDTSLNLTTTFSGVSLNSRMSWSLIGLEREFVSLKTTIGALTVGGTLIFSRNIIEANSDGQIVQISPNPGGLIGAYLPYVPSYTDPITPLTTLCRQLAPTLQSDPVIFRKKIAEVSLNVAGFKLGSTFIFANLGTAAASDFQVGTVFGASGQTVSGIEFESLTYLGMRNRDGYEFECFGQCHEDERFFQGRVVPGFRFEMERIQIKKLVLAGVNLDILAIFNFNASEGPLGVDKITLTSSAELKPLSLVLTDILTIGHSLQLAAHTLITTLSIGEGYLTAVFTDIDDPTNDAGFEFQTFIASFTLGDWNVTSTLYLCADDDADCAFLHAVYQHDITLYYTKDKLTLNGLVQFYGLISNFNKLVITLDYALGAVTLRSGTAIQADKLVAQEFSVKITF